MSRRPGRKITVFANKDAGTIRNLPSADFEAVIREGLKTRDVDAEIYLVKGNEIAARIQAVISLVGGAAGDPQTIVVGGGDGTLGCAASVLAGTDIVLGILPLGTLNHLAKDLGLPLDIDGALDVIAAGNAQLIDVAEVNGRVFVNNSSIGVYPFLVEERTAEQKRRRVGKLAAIVPALLTTLRATSWQQVTISAEGRQRSLRTACVFVGNNFYDLSAFGRREDLSSGQLCVYIVKPQTWLGLALLPFKVALGLTHSDRDLELFKVEKLSLRSSHHNLRVATDGETAREAPPLVYRIHPKALCVLAPARGDLVQEPQSQSSAQADIADPELQ